MLEVLTTLTVAYAIILVLVLAVTLITILFYLWRIGTTLSQISNGLKVVEQQTQPLAEKLDQINGGLVGVGQGLSGAASELSATDELLATLTGESTSNVAAA